MTDKQMEILMEENIPAEPTYPAWVIEVGKVDAEAFENAKQLHDRAMAEEIFHRWIEYNSEAKTLGDAFFWLLSEEGFDYWDEINEKIIEQCK